MHAPTPPARSAVIPTHNRPDELAACIAAIAPQVDVVVIIDNASDPSVADSGLAAPDGAKLVVTRDDEQPPNLSRLWNIGIDIANVLATLAGHTAWDVAVLNDDTVVPPGWMAAVSDAMRAHDATAGCSTPHGGSTVVHGPDAPAGIGTRLTGWAFVLRGEAGLRADEQLRWWCGDDDLSMRARHAGGLVHVPGYPVPNAGADTSTVGVLAEQAALDMQTFVDKWGRRPW